MKFLCGSCRTKYQISDEKVRGKILTIRCKKCGAKILVRESLAREAEGGAALAPVADGGLPSVTSGTRTGGSASLAAAYEAAMDRAPVSDADDMPTSIAPVPNDAGLAGFEWYVAIDGQQHGPFAFAELVEKVRRGDVIGRHYVWHDGMADWTRVRDLADLAPYLEAEGASQAPPPPPESQPSPSNVVEFPGRAAEAPEGAADTEVDTRALDEVHPNASGAVQPQNAVAADGPPAGAPAATGARNASEAGETKPGAIAASKTVPEGARPDLSLDLEDEDIFANVPRASPKELVQRESTKFFVAAAGVQNQKKRTRLGYYLAAAVVLLLVGFVGLWYAGIVRISLPGIGNPFARGYETTARVYESEGGDDDDYRVLLGEVETKQSSRGGRRPSRGGDRARGRRSENLAVGGSVLDELGEGGYVDEGSGGEPLRGRGDDGAPSVSIGSVGAKIDLPEGTALAQLPTESEVAVPPPDVEALDARTVQAVVASRRSSIRLCYDKSLKAKENLEGKLKIALLVEPNGQVSEARITSPAFARSVVGRCILSNVRNWRFPKFSGPPQEIELPFVFQRGS